MPARLPSIDMGRMLGRLAILVAVLIVLANIPVNSHGSAWRASYPRCRRSSASMG
jgi:hypothetical protein